jgi:hypothetical protein
MRSSFINAAGRLELHEMHVTAIQLEESM